MNEPMSDDEGRMCDALKKFPRSRPPTENDMVRFGAKMVHIERERIAHHMTYNYSCNRGTCETIDHSTADRMAADILANNLNHPEWNQMEDAIRADHDRTKMLRDAVYYALIVIGGLSIISLGFSVAVELFSRMGMP